MKKVLLLVLIMAGVSRVKAQIVMPLRVDTLSSNLFKNNLDKKPDTLGRRFLKPFKWNPAPMNHLDNKLAIANEDISPVDHMPIAHLHNNSNMPVAKVTNNSKMPVVNPRGYQWPDVSKPFGNNSK